MPRMSLPRHIALIPDGNRRWARERGLSTREGYEAGLKQILSIIDACNQRRIEVLTGWALSTDNLKRDPKQVKELVGAFENFLRKNKDRFLKNGIRLRFSGRRDRLPKSLLKLMKETEELTRKNKGIIVNFAVDYGGRDELIRTMKQIAADAKNEALSPNSITEDLISSYLDTEGLPDPDLVIRTSGEFRLSGYLPWQVRYAELFFTPVLFPDFTPQHLHKALLEYSKRERRFGGK